MIDLVKLYFKAGNGGNGKISFRREKFVPKGGPDGGDGGNGGDVVIVASSKIQTLAPFAGKKKFVVDDGEEGGKQKMSGAKSQDLVIEVPVGTTIWGVEPEIFRRFDLKRSWLKTVEKKRIKELTEDGQQIVLCRGGEGGRGNDRFKSSTNQTPMYYEPGTKGEEAYVVLELQLLADVGLVGFPNAGKSTLLSTITKASPRIANYPFTTLEPQLGVLSLAVKKGTTKNEVVVADIPGLIEGAHLGVGLGFQFLRHLEHCKLLIFMLYVDESLLEAQATVKTMVSAIESQYKHLTHELREYNPQLLQLPAIITLSKVDLLEENQRAEIMRELRGNPSLFPKIIALSSASGEGMDQLREEIQELMSVVQ